MVTTIPIVNRSRTLLNEQEQHGAKVHHQNTEFHSPPETRHSGRVGINCSNDRVSLLLTYHVETNTDERGQFVLSFTAMETRVMFRKSGYVETNLDFEAYEDRTDPPFSATTQNLTVMLESLRNGPKGNGQ